MAEQHFVIYNTDIANDHDCSFAPRNLTKFITIIKRLANNSDWNISADFHSLTIESVNTFEPVSDNSDEED